MCILILTCAVRLCEDGLAHLICSLFVMGGHFCESFEMFLQSSTCSVTAWRYTVVGNVIFDEFGVSWNIIKNQIRCIFAPFLAEAFVVVYMYWQSY